jgi:site-specific recombinase XerD
MEILKKADFDDYDDPTSFSFVSKKTHDSLTIFLNKYSRELYQKYKDVPTRDGLMFPPKSNQKMNDQLKEIAKLLGFTREVTKMQWNGVDRVIVTEPLCDVIGTHSARRTFVVHALEEGMSPQIVMTFTGHEDYDSLKPYIAITDKTTKNLMTTVFSK